MLNGITKRQSVEVGFLSRGGGDRSSSVILVLLRVSVALARIPVEFGRIWV